ncbi:hypothetical protein [Sinomicrobium weinanense]|uniref:YbbR-like domain-containing protein n=1 Tax=Sinomicrobium weinanense TaxID=2842200 RepID=A0A926JWH4_9FLAO|nr:hypothetical protein [Sinomicrobium weinanense]MBC9798646.1 hypothetical protein [Sinomicrobium weinanense]MBU3122368.1 hypothetical protein [Sinomicrobium weinanense]
MASILSRIKKYKQKIWARLKGERASLFMFFFLFSCVLWFLIKLPDRYTTTVSVQPNYTGVPEGQLLVNPVREIRMDVNAKGFKLFNLKYFESTVDIDLSELRKTGNKFYLLATDIRKQLRTAMPGEVELRQLDRDTLFFQLGKNITREVKVIPEVEVSFARDYHIYDSLTVSPGKISVFGPDVEVNELDTLYTVKLMLRDVSDDIHINAAVNIPKKYRHLKFKDKKVTVSASVERFSEEKLTVPVSVVNVPEDKTVRTFPSEVDIVCQGALKDLGKLKPSDFTVACDYKAIADSMEYVPIRVTKMPETVRRIKLSRKQVEVLIKNTKTGSSG